MLRTGEATYAVPKRVVVEVEGDRHKGHPDLRVECAMIDGQPLVREVHVTAAPNGRAIRDADLSVLALDKIALDAFLEHALVVNPYVAAPGNYRASPLTLHRDAGDLANGLRKAQRGRANARPLEELRRVAEVYRENLDCSPRSRVIAVLGYSDRTADRRIKEAEAAGLLQPRGRGKRRNSENTPK